MKLRINNAERERWVNNEYTLYNLWCRSKLSMRNFIKENKEIIDNLIRSVCE